MMSEVTSPRPIRGKYQNRKKRQRFSQKEREAYLKAFAIGNQSKEAFCRQHGLSRSVLYQWLRKASKAETAQRPTMGFRPVTQEAVSSCVPQKQVNEEKIDMLLPNSIKISLTKSIDLHWLGKLVRELTS